MSEKRGAYTAQMLKLSVQGPTVVRKTGGLTSNRCLNLFVYGMVFFPVFASLALSSAFSFGVGSLYVWMFFVVDVYKVTECDLTLVRATFSPKLS